MQASRPAPLTRASVGIASLANEGVKIALSGVTDWYIPEARPDDTFLYPGAQKASLAQRQTARTLLALAKSACYPIDEEGHRSDTLDDYRIEFEGRFYRGHRQRTVDGVFHILRATTVVPDSKNLGLPNAVRNLLCCAQLGEMGGLVLVSGRPGHGKSTTSASIILERVKQHGAFCLTVENPVEFPISGTYPAPGGRNGTIIQVEAVTKCFADELRDALRCYPSNYQGSMLLVGEVRDAETASQVIRAAANGQLVFMTTHAGNPVLCLERLMALASAQFRDQREVAVMLASTLRALVHQELVNGKLSVNTLFSFSTESEVAAVLAGGDPRMLQTEINRQKTLLANNQLESYILKGIEPRIEGRK